MTRRPDARWATLWGSIGVLSVLALPQSARGQDQQGAPEPHPLQKAVDAQISSEPPPLPKGR